MANILALDFGGTKLSAGIVDSTSGQIIEVVRKLTPEMGGADRSLEAIIQAGRESLSHFHPGSGKIEGIGISFGGPLHADRRTVSRSMHIEGWDNKPLADLVSHTFDLPVVMDNDSNLAALGEWRFGAGQGARSLLFVQISTGIGGGIVLNGKIYRGRGFAGEIGHTTVLVDGPLCPCGKRGCAESLASGWALARDGRELLRAASGTSPLRRLSQNHPQAIDARLLFDSAREGDEQAAQIVQRAFYYLGIGIANAINLLSPDRVVLGGGITKAGDIMLNPLKAAITAHQLSSANPADYPTITLAALIDNAPMIGAAVLFESEMA